MARARHAVRGNMLFGSATAFDGGILVGSAAWFEWLEPPETTSFRFEQEADGFTARREQRPGGRYWYAYRKRAGQLYKAYLGRSAELTPHRLLAVAAALARRGVAPTGGGLRLIPFPTPILQMRRGNIPAQPTSFVGREHELSDVRRLLETTHLLTLTGPAGVGKTRFALELVGRLVDAYADGIWVVELAPLVDPDLVTHSVASVLGIPDRHGGARLATLSQTLASKQLLLILDNCEHLVAPCAEVADALLRHCPHIRVLATSRTLLNVAGEMVVGIQPLVLAPTGTPPTVEAVAQSEAGRLFIERVRAMLAIGDGAARHC